MRLCIGSLAGYFVKYIIAPYGSLGVRKRKRQSPFKRHLFRTTLLLGRQWCKEYPTTKIDIAIPVHNCAAWLDALVGSIIIGRKKCTIEGTAFEQRTGVI